MANHDVRFMWDEKKEQLNREKHGIDFYTAVRAFKDPYRKIFSDEKHSLQEERLFCIGAVDGRIVTVRFTYRGDIIRIVGAGYWRKGRKYYEAK